jgi:tRNA threonylcarbamoyladenosine biosynthesis protein TsaB
MANQVRILAFDTSSTVCSVALLDTHQSGQDEIITLQDTQPKQAQLILPMILDLLRASSITLNQLDAIAYGCGPGRFTGTRIASTVAQGIGFALSLPIIRISSLAAIAQAAYLERAWTSLFVCLDARMKRVYGASYQVNSKGDVELVDKERLILPESLSRLPSGQWYGVGDGWATYQVVLTHQLGCQLQDICATQLPSARAIAQLAKGQFAQGNWITAEEALPADLMIEGEGGVSPLVSIDTIG